jgi:hypothetical protein
MNAVDEMLRRSQLLAAPRERLADVLKLGAQASAKCEWIARDSTMTVLARFAELDGEANAAADIETIALAFARLELLLPDIEKRIAAIAEMLSECNEGLDALLEGSRNTLDLLPEPTTRTLTAPTPT